MKPDWKDAPEGARWLAMNENGSWFWHFKKPKLTKTRFGCYWHSDENIYAPVDFNKSLEKRPVESKEAT